MSDFKVILEGQKFNDRKIPLYTVLFKQFPNALKEVAKCSAAGHIKYPNDVDWMNFKRVENSDVAYKEAGIRHLTESGINQDMLEYGLVTHEAQVVWNFLADLEINLTKIPSQKELV